MPKTIVWSPLSEADLENILDYLDRNWSNQVVNGFIEIIEKLLLQISKSPKQFPLINKKRKNTKMCCNKAQCIILQG